MISRPITFSSSTGNTFNIQIWKLKMVLSFSILTSQGTNQKVSRQQNSKNFTLKSVSHCLIIPKKQAGLGLFAETFIFWFCNFSIFPTWNFCRKFCLYFRLSFSKRFLCAYYAYPILYEWGHICPIPSV